MIRLQREGVSDIDNDETKIERKEDASISYMSKRVLKEKMSTENEKLKTQKLERPMGKRWTRETLEGCDKKGLLTQSASTSPGPGHSP